MCRPIQRRSVFRPKSFTAFLRRNPRGKWIIVSRRLRVTGHNFRFWNFGKGGSSMGRLAGKTAFISGGARGLGAEMARLLHGEGANVMVTDILEEEGHALANDHENMTFMAHDVLQEDQWVTTIAATKEAYGGLDILVNNAGIAHNYTTIEETTLEQWRKVVGIDLDAVFLGCKHGVGLMKENGGGSIINISSIYGIVGSAGQGPYQ
ncbi:MAG TPA: hypothetical protein DCP12_05195, partial [Rhodobiaceae bacterium]|nr:hypothetical protein [Rhodobiaceae bacterium]